MEVAHRATATRWLANPAEKMRQTRIAMIVIGRVIWLVALPLPGYNPELLLLHAALVVGDVRAADGA